MPLQGPSLYLANKLDPPSACCGWCAGVSPVSPAATLPPTLAPGRLDSPPALGYRAALTPTRLSINILYLFAARQKSTFKVDIDLV